MATAFERISLKMAVGLTAIVPLTNGLLGMFKGTSMLEKSIRSNLQLDSHFRYLSGLPLGMGLLLLRSLPNIETNCNDLRCVTLLIFIGGLGRLWGLITTGRDRNTILLTLSELLVLPLVCVYQNYVQKKISNSQKEL